ncbi:unnamed protein product, partial [Allacma fusca]
IKSSIEYLTASSFDLPLKTQLQNLIWSLIWTISRSGTSKASRL